jgi:methionyl-tRNA synthetase
MAFAHGGGDLCEECCDGQCDDVCAKAATDMVNITIRSKIHLFFLASASADREK